MNYRYEAQSQGAEDDDEKDVIKRDPDTGDELEEESSDEPDSEEDDDDSEDEDSSDEKPKSDSDEEDEKPNQGASEEDADDEEAEAKREARRIAKKEKRQRQREARDADKAEIANLRRRLDEMSNEFTRLDKRGSAQELAQLDTAIQQHEQAASLAEKRIKETMGRDNDACIAAMNARDEIRDRLNNLKGHREVMVRQETRLRTQKRPPADPQMMAHAQRFVNEHKWYDPTGKDRDSKLVLAIDESLTDQGFQSNTPEYWQRLRAEVKRVLPHRFEQEQRTKTSNVKKFTGKPGNMGGGGVAKSNVPGKKTIVLSKERQEAMRQAGLHPGTKAWDKMARSYKSYDKQQRSK